MPKAVECRRLNTAQPGVFAAVINQHRRANNTDQDGPCPALRWTDACSYTTLTHYRQWDSCKADGEHRGSPCRDNLRIVYPHFLQTIKKSQKTMRKKEIFLSLLVVVGRVKSAYALLSQMCPIWRKRVLTISPSLAQFSLPSHFSPTPSRATAP